MFLIEAKRIAVVILGSFLLAISLNFFLIGANVYASGFSGVAQLLSSVSKDFLLLYISTGIILFVFYFFVLFLIDANRILFFILCSFLLAISLIFFLIGANVYASGFSGVAQLLSSVSKDFLSLDISTGIILFVLNVPVLIIGWFKIGRGFTIY